MKKLGLIILFLSVVLSLFSNWISEEKMYEYNSNCITVVLHGYWSKYDMNEFGDATGVVKSATQFKDVFITQILHGLRQIGTDYDYFLAKQSIFQSNKSSTSGVIL